jgi:tetratricopeptide (TPR) repeat protein
LFSIGKNQEAIEYYQNALSIQPDFYEARFELGLAFVQQQNYDAAFFYFELALVSKPNSPEILYN